jgi:hypothetical protein
LQGPHHTAKKSINTGFAIKIPHALVRIREI